MLIIELVNVELTGGHIGFILVLETSKTRINRQPYWNYSNLEMAKIELTSGHIGID